MRWRLVLVAAYFLGPLSTAQTPSEADGRTVVMPEFSEVRFQGTHARFFTVIERVHSRRVSVKIVEPRGLLGIAAVVVDQASVVPEHGLQMTWKTLNIGDR